MLPTPSRTRTLTRALVGVLAPAAALVALTPAPAHAATGDYRAVTTTAVTVRNAAGQVVFTCPMVNQLGTMYGMTSGVASVYLELTQGLDCPTFTGEKGALYGNSGFGFGYINFTSTGYDATTGVTKLIGNRAYSEGIIFSATNCRINFNKFVATYNNRTQIMKYTSATAESGGCYTVLRTPQTVTFDAEFKLSPR
ncbi:hypothetical protein [Actinomadura macrotermitis]|uniref:Tat pathway signal sequence domain protein n=1 Tax=Actinomadura macrotermitis TaxID=2585200 RepID=A0A7K0C049_9ACTN|nr:hypothetical protein [Actinomadura macrotermitis]MQY06696.1 hypothetical protein [Actinomadura macrotermitis]